MDEQTDRDIHERVVKLSCSEADGLAEWLRELANEEPELNDFAVEAQRWADLVEPRIVSFREPRPWTEEDAAGISPLVRTGGPV